MLLVVVEFVILIAEDVVVSWICRFSYGVEVLIPKLVVDYSQWSSSGYYTAFDPLPTNNFFSVREAFPVPPLPTPIAIAKITFY